MKRISAAVVCIFLILSCAGCNKEPKSAFKFKEKTYLEEREDGWVYFSELDFSDDDEYYYYTYDAYNLKHKEIADYYIRIYDEQTGEEVGSTSTVMPYLSLLPQAEKDIRNINFYFEEKRFFQPSAKLI